MVRERLGQIKRNWDYGRHVNAVDMEWLIEQAERLHGTEHKYGYKDMHRICNSDYADLKDKNKRLRERLKLIKQRSSCIMAVSHATKALEGDHERD